MTGFERDELFVQRTMQLYDMAYREKTTDFKQLVFKWLNNIVPFQSGIWATRSDIFHLHQINWVDDTFMYNLPDRFMESYHELASNSQSTDLLNQFLLTNQDSFHTIWDVVPKESWEQNDFYKKHCALFGVEQAAAALIAPNNMSSISHAISFYRDDPSLPFSPAEVATLNRLLPAIRGAFKTNLVQSLSNKLPDSYIIGHRLIVDRFGKIIEATDRARTLLERYRLIEGISLHIDDLTNITDDNILSLVIDDLTIRAVLEHGLVLLEVTTLGAMFGLTQRQKKICFSIFKGKDYAHIEDEMSLSPKLLQAEITKIRKAFKLERNDTLVSFLVKQRAFFDGTVLSNESKVDE